MWPNGHAAGLPIFGVLQRPFCGDVNVRTEYEISVDEDPHFLYEDRWNDSDAGLASAMGSDENETSGPITARAITRHRSHAGGFPPKLPAGPDDFSRSADQMIDANRTRPYLNGIDKTFFTKLKSQIRHNDAVVVDWLSGRIV